MPRLESDGLLGIGDALVAPYSRLARTRDEVRRLTILRALAGPETWSANREFNYARRRNLRLQDTDPDQREHQAAAGWALVTEATHGTEVRSLAGELPGQFEHAPDTTGEDIADAWRSSFENYQRERHETATAVREAEEARISAESARSDLRRLQKLDAELIEAGARLRRGEAVIAATRQAQGLPQLAAVPAPREFVAPMER